MIEFFVAFLFCSSLFLSSIILLKLAIKSYYELLEMIAEHKPKNNKGFKK